MLLEFNKLIPTGFQELLSHKSVSGLISELTLFVTL
jgi:hypothetical protein